MTPEELNILNKRIGNSIKKFNRNLESPAVLNKQWNTVTSNLQSVHYLKRIALTASAK